MLTVIFFDRPHFAGTEWGWVLAASLLGVPVLYLLVFKGLSLTTVSHASLMVGTLPMRLAVAHGCSDPFSLQSSRDVKRPAAVVTKAGATGLAGLSRSSSRVFGIAVRFVTAPVAMDGAAKVSMFYTLVWQGDECNALSIIQKRPRGGVGTPHLDLEIALSLPTD